jgi:hypothetical protein
VTTVNISENVAHFKHFEKTVRNKILIWGEIKIEFRECLLPFSPEPFVLIPAVKNLKIR